MNFHIHPRLASILQAFGTRPASSPMNIVEQTVQRIRWNRYKAVGQHVHARAKALGSDSRAVTAALTAAFDALDEGRSTSLACYKGERVLRDRAPNFISTDGPEAA